MRRDTRLRVARNKIVDPETYEKRRLNALASVAKREARQAEIAAETVKDESGYNLTGFYAVARSLKIKLKRGGVSTLGQCIRPNQEKLLKAIKQKRAERKLIRRFDVKCRQLTATSSVVGAAIAADAEVNEGVDAFVTAHQKPSLMSLSQIYRYLFGRTKDVREAGRISDFLYETRTGSRITLQLADEDLGRSGSVTHLHVSEADYIPNWTEAWRSVEPCMSDAYWSMVIMETTLRRGLNSQFRDVLLEAEQGMYAPWEVHFTAWWEVPELKVDLTPEGRLEMLHAADEYEKYLHDGLNLSWDQVMWHHEKRRSGMFGNLDAMKEAYPSTFKEAIEHGVDAPFFTPEAIKFYRDNVREPLARYTMSVENELRELKAGENLGRPHVAMWEPPGTGEYVIGADCSDSEKRQKIEGSENYGVVVEQGTGVVCAEWHGRTSAAEFALVLARLAERYNGAMIIPEANNAGGAVIDHVRQMLRHGSLYQREKIGLREEGYFEGVYGFDTKGGTRETLVERLRRGINERLFDIPSRYLLDQVVAFGKNSGVKARAQQAGVTPDDGCIALGLTCFGHRNCIDGTWKPKQARVHSLIPSKEAAPQRKGWGVRVEAERPNKPKYDPVFGVYR